jgi:predicted GTPase
VRVDDPSAIAGKRVVVVEDGPTTTHGGMPHGAGYAALKNVAHGGIVNPRPYAAPRIAKVYRDYPHLGPVLPAMGYGAAQLADLERTINAVPADVIVCGAPIDLGALIRVGKPVVRVRYDYADVDAAGLAAVVTDFLGHHVPD